MAYTYSQLKALWIKYGGNAASADTAAAVALAESGGVPTASNSNTDGSIDRGLWQINSVHGSLSTFDVAANTKAAIKISNNGSSWSPWVTYTTGAFRKFLSPGTPAGNAPADATATTAGITIPGLGGISVSGVVNGIMSTFLKAIGLSNMKDMLERLGLIILGFVLVIVGIHLLASGSGSQAFTVNEPKQEGRSEGGSNRKTKSSPGTTKTAAKSVGASEAVEAAAVA